MRETVLRVGAHDSDSENCLILAGQGPLYTMVPSPCYSKGGSDETTVSHLGRGTVPIYALMKYVVCAFHIRRICRITTSTVRVPRERRKHERR